MTFTGPAEDLRVIRELLERYSDAVMRQDVEAYLATWTEHGERRGDGGECDGHGELGAHFRATFTTIEQMGFFAQPASTSVEGDSATARSYTLELIKQRDGGKFQVVGEYTDDLARTATGWAFSRRSYRVVMVA